MNTCETCRFRGRGNAQYTECRRYAPTMIDDFGIAKFPNMVTKDGCGEYEPKPEEKTDA